MTLINDYQNRTRCVSCDEIDNDHIARSDVYYCHGCIDFVDVRGFKNLPKVLKRHLIRVYWSHYNSWGSNARINYTIDNIKRVRYNSSEIVIEIYFANGDWYKYHPNGSWS